MACKPEKAMKPGVKTPTKMLPKKAVKPAVKKK